MSSTNGDCSSIVGRITCQVNKLYEKLLPAAECESVIVAPSGQGCGDVSFAHFEVVVSIWFDGGYFKNNEPDPE